MRFQSYKCFQNDYALTELHENSIISCCADLRYNQNFKSVISRAKDVKQFTNNQYMSYVQLKSWLDYYVGLVNKLKLDMLNLNRSHLCLQNKNNDMKRLMFYMATDDLPRVNAILKVCLKQNMGVHAILEKVKAATGGFYHAKSFTKKEKDLDILTYKIGGPRLVR